MTQNRSGPPSGIGGTADDRAENNASALLHQKPSRQIPQRSGRECKELPPSIGDNSLPDLAARLPSPRTKRTTFIPGHAAALAAANQRGAA